MEKAYDTLGWQSWRTVTTTGLEEMGIRKSEGTGGQIARRLASNVYIKSSLPVAGGGSSKLRSFILQITSPRPSPHFKPTYFGKTQACRVAGREALIGVSWQQWPQKRQEPQSRLPQTAQNFNLTSNCTSNFKASHLSCSSSDA